MKRKISLFLCLILILLSFNFILEPLPIHATLKEGTTGQDVIDYGKQFVGNPYKWGGTSLTNGCDCSGFVLAVYKNFGVDLPHESKSMHTSKNLEKVEGVKATTGSNGSTQITGDNLKKMCPGDVVVWNGHVGLYYGEGKLLHAQSAKTGIVISDKVSSGHPFTGVYRVKGIINNGATSGGSGNGSDGSWCKVKIKQGGVGHGSGCTVCTLQLILQNSGQLKENQLSGTFTSATEDYKKFDKACSSAGFASGDAWVLGNVISGFNSMCNSKWSCGVGSGVSTKNYNGMTAVTGVNGKNFLDMSMDEQLASVKTLYNSGYYATFCVKYASVKNPTANGPNGFKANHATMLAGVTTDEIYINDPADGTVKAYSTAKSSSKGAYQLVYCIILKNDKSSLMSEGGGSVGGSGEGASGGAAEITNADEQAAQNLGIPMAALKGAYSESQLSSIFTLNEVPLEIADASSLSINEHYNLHNWRDTIYSSMEDTLLVRLMRRFVSFLGIMFTVWMIFLYLAYWFDRVNVFFEFSLLLILSGDKLCLSDSEEKCTWQLKDLIKSKNKGAKSVNHRAMLQIVILGTLFGGIITSGVLFKAIRIFIVFILNVLKMWG